LTQIRVHELASELNVSTQQVLIYLEELGKKVRGPSTVIGVSVAAKVRGRFRASRSSVAQPKATNTALAPSGRREAEESAESHRWLDAEVPRKQPPVSGVSPAVETASPPPSLFLPPVSAPTTAAVTRPVGAFANPFTVPADPKNPATQPPPRDVPAPPQTRGVVTRVAEVTPPAVTPDRDHDAEWEASGFSPTDRAKWESAGLRPADATLADRCRSADIAPEDLPTKLSGRTALQRLRDGEASTSVWARIREAEQQPRRVGTKLTGRFQLS